MSTDTLLTDEVRAWIDRPSEPVRAEICRRDIVKFAIATGETNQLHLDVEAARAGGHADLVAPPLFYVTLRTGLYNLVPLGELDEEGTPVRDLPPVDFHQAMAGETEAELHAPFVAGEQIECTRTVLDAFEKVGRSGPLLFVVFEYRYATVDGQLKVVERFTRIFR